MSDVQPVLIPQADDAPPVFAPEPVPVVVPASFALDRYAKALIPALVTILTAASSAISDGHITLPELVTIVVLILTTAGVYATPNAPKA